MKRITALAGCAVLALAAAACGGGGHPASAKACKAAMTRDYRYALDHPGAPPASRPGACKGLPDATVSQLAAQVLAGS